MAKVSKQSKPPKRRKRTGPKPGTPAPGTEPTLQKAALLKAQGFEWDRIAKALSLNAPSLQHLVNAHTQLFEKHFNACVVDELKIMEVLGLLAATKLVDLMDNPDDRIAESAAHSLLSNRVKLIKQVIDHTGNVNIQLYSQETPIEALGPPPKDAPAPPPKPRAKGRKK